MAVIIELFFAWLIEFATSVAVNVVRTYLPALSLALAG